MKKKIFFVALSLFLVFFCLTLMIISIITLRDNLSSVKEKCLSEHFVIASALTGDMQALDERNVDIVGSINSLMNKYARYSQGKGNAMGLSYKGEWVYLNSYPKYGNAIKNPAEIAGDASDQERTVYIEKNPEPILYIYGKLPAPYQDYGLLFITDLNSSLSAWRQMKNNLFLTGTITAVILALFLGIFLNAVFRPLRQISAVSSTIAGGEYDKRLPVKGKDEIADMAVSFNNMAGQVEAHIKKLEETAEQKQQFVDNFAHELKTPLTAIYGYAEYIQKANISDDERVECTGYIMSECERLQNMAYQLLDLATLRDIEMEECVVKELFEESERIMRQKAKEKNVRLKYAASDEVITGSRELLVSLFNNLIDNAIKASEDGSEVLVSVRLGSGDGDDIGAGISTGLGACGLHNIVEVADTGVGMDKEQLSHIKEAFYRVDKARSRELGGAGLGLSICDKIAKLHNAELVFDSEPGKGTTAKVIF